MEHVTISADWTCRNRRGSGLCPVARKQHARQFVSDQLAEGALRAPCHASVTRPSPNH